MKINSQKKKIIYSLVFVTVITGIIMYLYPYSDHSIKDIRTHSYVYNYNLPKNLTVKDVSKLPEAESVPILMYHGVIINTQLGENIKRENFISQMEMLKREGYQTVSIKEFALWRDNKFTLPPKPIMITFDDGRKDSYYTVDEIFRKLGFKGTIFVATIKAINKDPFYIGWKELEKMKQSGRWEIESHGRNSHERIAINENGDLGTYLTSRIYSDKSGLESIDGYEKRVEQDYANVKSDLLNNLGIDSNYYAIPFAEYGLGDISNHPKAYEYNSEIAKKYFKYTFRSYSSNNKVTESFYNYKDTNPYQIKRLNVKNITSDELLAALILYSAKPKKLSFMDNVDDNFIKENMRILYGEVETDKGINLKSAGGEQSSTRIILGDEAWKNYEIKAKITKERGRSVTILGYYTNEDNYIFFNWGDEKLELLEKVNGVDYSIASHYPFITKDRTLDMTLVISNGNVRATALDITLKGEYSTKLKRGAVGFTVWDPDGAESTINRLELIEPN